MGDRVRSRPQINVPTREQFLASVRRNTIYRAAVPPPPPPIVEDDGIPDYIKTLEAITFNFLRRQPFPRNHPERMSLVRLCVQSDNEVELTCFLIEHGYVDLYQEISVSLNHRLYDMPIPVRNRIENAYLKFISEESNETFMEDHDKRERGDSVADRIDEIIQKYPLTTATKQMIQQCPKCAICQYKIRKRQHVRKTCESCMYHRKCADDYLVQARTCAICRRTLIEDS